MWMLEPSAVKDGVKSTTRYRKRVLKKSSKKSRNPCPRRRQSGAKGGRVQARLRHAAKPEKLDDLRIGELEIRASSG